jgi:hypothetical protein
LSAKKKRPSVDELVAQYRDEVTAPAAEILRQIYSTLLATPEFVLADGRVAKIEAYYPPEADEEDKMHCGIDVRLSDGTQLEFRSPTLAGKSRSCTSCRSVVNTTSGRDSLRVRTLGKTTD